MSASSIPDPSPDPNREVKTLNAPPDDRSANSSTEKYSLQRADLPPVIETVIQFDALVVSVGYVDVGPREGDVIVAVHGAMGGLQGLAELFQPLSKAGYRVVAPEFPGKYRSI